MISDSFDVLSVTSDVLDLLWFSLYLWGFQGYPFYLKGFAPMPPAPCFLSNGGYEAKWLRKSGSLAWLGAWETLGKTKKGSKIKNKVLGVIKAGDLAKLENEATMDQKARKLIPESPNETNMDPKCPPKGALEASKRPLGAESSFRCFLVSFWTPQIV